MPKKAIDWSKTIIYKIICRDVNVPDGYVGSTTNLMKRKCNHKSNCNNSNAKEYNFFVYKFIRDHCGWENFDVVQIEQYKAKDKNDAHARERYWIETLKATLNKKAPIITKKEKEQYGKKYQIKYYQNNKDKLQKLRKKSVKCICNSNHTLAGKIQHLKSDKHKLFMEDYVPKYSLF